MESEPQNQRERERSLERDWQGELEHNRQTDRQTGVRQVEGGCASPECVLKSCISVT